MFFFHKNWTVDQIVCEFKKVQTEFKWNLHIFSHIQSSSLIFRLTHSMPSSQSTTTKNLQIVAFILWLHSYRNLKPFNLGSYTWYTTVLQGPCALVKRFGIVWIRLYKSTWTGSKSFDYRFAHASYVVCVLQSCKSFTNRLTIAHGPTVWQVAATHFCEISHRFIPIYFILIKI